MDTLKFKNKINERLSEKGLDISLELKGENIVPISCGEKTSNYYFLELGVHTTTREFSGILGISDYTDKMFNFMMNEEVLPKSNTFNLVSDINTTIREVVLSYSAN